MEEIVNETCYIMHNPSMWGMGSDTDCYLITETDLKRVIARKSRRWLRKISGILENCVGDRRFNLRRKSCLRLRIKGERMKHREEWAGKNYKIRKK